MISLLRQGLVTLSLFAFLLLPVNQAFGGFAASAFCGSGQAQSALALKMQQVASVELLEHLGLSTPQDEHCPQCVGGGLSALVSSVALFAFDTFGHALAVQLRSIATRSIPQYFQARAPPSFPV